MCVWAGHVHLKSSALDNGALFNVIRKKRGLHVPLSMERNLDDAGGGCLVESVWYSISFDEYLGRGIWLGSMRDSDLDFFLAVYCDLP